MPEPLRKVGDAVFVSADNMGSPAEIIAVRDSTGSPPSHYKVRTATDGQEFWAFDFEVGDPLNA